MKMNNFAQIPSTKMLYTYLQFVLILASAPLSYSHNGPSTLESNAHRIVRAVAGNNNKAGGLSNQNQKHSLLLINNNECPELKTLCSHIDPTSDDDNLGILDCISTFQANQLESLNEKCQHSIWLATNDFLSINHVTQLLPKYCPDHEMNEFRECGNSLNHYLNCLKEKSERFEDTCRIFIRRIHRIIFPDYENMEFFFNDCGKDIKELQCGRLNVERKPISQIETTACLQESIHNVDVLCKNAIAKVNQQNDDLQFFDICSNDLNRLCPKEHSGTSGAFKCLVKNKNNPTMSQKCNDQIAQRDKAIARDYKASRGLAKACKEDIRVHHCRRGVSEDKNVRLAQILLCLESISKNGTKIAEECRAEIDDHRKMLMMDYQMSPEILIGCSDDISKFCTDLDKLQNTIGGEVIHCLLDHVRSKRRKDRRVTSSCQRALEKLVKVSDAGEDWRIDPVLRRACKPVVDQSCSDADGGEARVMSCLMGGIGTPVMTKDCEEALLLIQYFVARDYKLDPQLYKKCKDDALEYCHAKAAWDDESETGQMDPERGPLILPCLHRIAYSDVKNIALREDCYKEVKRVMRQRAISVELLPEVEDACLEDLSIYCADKTGKGAEMICLQDNLEKLRSNCRDVVTTYTEEEAGHVELNPVIMINCKQAMDTYCSHILKQNRGVDMMDCLIAHKNDADLRQNTKCRAAIEHFQIISLKNYHFTYKFKEACRPHVARFCSSSKTKYEVVACLSEVMRNDTIRGQRHTIPKECRQQVKAQLYQQRESILLDPKLANACKKEINDYCNDEQSPGQAIECLALHTGQLGEACHHAMFLIKRSELGDSATDYTLVTTCKEMTYKFCPKSEVSSLLDCLKIYKDHPMFDPRCHLVVVNRMIEQNTDFRFNPSLQLACGRNIDQFCSNIVAAAKPNEELNGKVVECLKEKFREGRLESQCEKKMIEVLQEQALNYKLNPILKNFCKSEIDVLCKDHINQEEHGLVEECLKTAFVEQKIINHDCKIEVATLIAEAKADIQADPMLQDACTVDLLRYCTGIKSGNGRKLKCLQVILQDQSKAMEEDCRNKLSRRIEMFRNADIVLAVPPENMEQLVMQVTTSPAKKFFILVVFSCLGMVFIMGMFLGRVSKRALNTKNK